MVSLGGFDGPVVLVVFGGGGGVTTRVGLSEDFFADALVTGVTAGSTVAAVTTGGGGVGSAETT